MKFYNREKELEKLRNIQHSSLNGSKMSVVVGRRRIGKTKLIKEAYAEKVYLFVSKKK
jgi:AAA+ ATPase superfamily predicted ATPase